MTAQTASHDEPLISLPTGRLLVAVIGACATSTAAWLGVVSLGAWGREVLMAGPVGALAVAVTGVAGVVVMTPWKTRDMITWWTMWLAATVLRLLLTPVAAFLLYSATPLSPEALCLAIAASYFLALMAEAAIIARHVHRATQPQ